MFASYEILGFVDETSMAELAGQGRGVYPAC
jgi:hypothetical protein